MPQMVVWPFMAATMVEDALSVKAVWNGTAPARS
jgi:hypothetical protein